MRDLEPVEFKGRLHIITVLLISDMFNSMSEDSHILLLTCDKKKNCQNVTVERSQEEETPFVIALKYEIHLEIFTHKLFQISPSVEGNMKNDP